MTYHDARIPQILREMRWRIRPERFTLAGIEPHELPVALRLLASVTAPFFQLIVEPGMLTLVLPQEEWRALRPAFPSARVEQPLRLIAFDVDLPPDLVGFMALLSGALADEGVTLLVICSYARDSLLVREADLERAAAAIERLIARAAPG
jgi:hypothetical protein